MTCSRDKIAAVEKSRKKGVPCFGFNKVSYNARYAKHREAKNAHFPEFWRFSLGWLIIRLGSIVLHILRFFTMFYRFICLTLSDASYVMRCFIGSFVILLFQ